MCRKCIDTLFIRANILLLSLVRIVTLRGESIIKLSLTISGQIEENTAVNQWKQESCDDNQVNFN